MVLYLGKVMELAERDAFYANPMHPYSKALISAIPLPDPKAERARERVDAAGRPAVGAQSAERLPVLHPLPDGDRAVP